MASGATPCHTSCYKQNKHGSNQETRKLLVGALERDIIEYAVSQGRRFTVALVVSHYHPSAQGKERTRLLKRYHDAVKRLERRGFVKKVGRGVYELVKDMGLSDIRGEPKERVCGAGRAARAGRGATLVRVHIAARSGDGYLDMYYRLAVLHYVSGCLLRALEGYLLSMGVSKSRLRRIRREARRIADIVCSSPKLAGVHGVWGGRGVFAPLEALSKVPVHYAEVGFDVVVPAAIPKLFIKFYTKPLPKSYSLERWFGGYAAGV